MQHPCLAPGAPRATIGVALVAGSAVLVSPWMLPGAAGTLTATLAGAGERVLTAVQCVSLVAVMAATHLGVVRWTRPALGRRGFDPDHLVNAVCAVVVLVLVPALQLLLHRGSEREIELGSDLPMFVAAGCGVVVVVVLLLTTRVAWRRGNPRPPLLVTALALVVAGTAAILVDFDQQTWLLMTRTPWPVALVVCAALPVVPRPAERVDVVLSTVTGYAVVAAALPVVAVAANLPASALRDAELPERVSALLAEHGVLPEDVVLEVTETLLLRDPARSAAVVHALRATGVGVSIDDVVTGYSSLARLRHLPVDELELVHAPGLRVVAEGVEDEATLLRLGQLGCDEAQGYLLAAPMPAAEVAAWWRARVATADALRGAVPVNG